MEGSLRGSMLVSIPEPKGDDTRSTAEEESATELVEQGQSKSPWGCVGLLAYGEDARDVDWDDGAAVCSQG